MQISDYLSITAIIISAISLYISWREYERDRSQLKASLSIVDDNKGGETFLLKIVNSGRRPVNIRTVYARLRNRRRYPVFDTLTLLEETKNLEISIPFEGFKNPGNVVAFEVDDTTGRRYSIKTRRVNRVHLSYYK